MLQDVGGVGQKGKIVEVSDGYALNFLIPNGKAEQATPEKEAEVVRRSLAEAQQKEKGDAQIVAAIRALDDADVQIHVRATDKGGLFKAITAQDIIRAIHEQKKIDIPVSAVQLAKPIKEIGEHVVVLQKDKTASKMRFIVKSQQI